MNRSESIKEISTALAAFQGEVVNPNNSKTVNVATKSGNSYSYKYAPLDEILKIVRPLLAKNGLSLIQAPYTQNVEVTIITTLFHISGEWIEFPPLAMKAENNTPQAIGSVITYARRYSLSAVLGIASDDDTDAQPIGSQNPRIGTSKENKGGKPEDNKGKDLVTKNQLNLIKRLMGEKSFTDEAVNAYIINTFSKKNIEDLNAKEASELITMLKSTNTQ